MPRALIAAPITVTAIYLLVTFAAIGAQNWTEFRRPEGRSRGHPRSRHRWAPLGHSSLPAGAVISIFSVTLVTLYGKPESCSAMGRDGLLPPMFAKVDSRRMTPVNNTIVVMIAVSILAGVIP